MSSSTNCPLDVCITFDIEFDINGALEHPDTKHPIATESVYRHADGKSHGLTFILDTLSKYGLQGTFFTEVFNTYYFGDEPISQVINDIRKAQQDVQLHLHPCWHYFKDPKWATLIKQITPNDSLANRQQDALNMFLQEGVIIFDRLTGRRPMALRTGNLHADHNLYTAMSQQNISISSSIGTAIFTPPEPDLHLNGGVHLINGVKEIPVCTYHDLRIGSKHHNKLLTITGSSWSEIKALLLSAWRQHAGPLVLLTHASEFSLQKESPSSLEYQPLPINQKRFSQLCDFLANNQDKFNTVTFADAAPAWETTEKNIAPLQSPLYGLIHRLIENCLLSR